MKQQLSPDELQAYREEKKARIMQIRKKLTELSDEQRNQLIADNGLIVTIEGHPLTPYNTCFVYSQTERPVTVVGGFKQWRKAGRSVKKGEHGFLIFVPSAKGKAEEPAPGPTAAGEVEDVFFFTSTVFDISQTMEIENAN